MGAAHAKWLAIHVTRHIQYVALERSEVVKMISTMLELIINRGIFKTSMIEDLYHLSHHFLMYV